MPMVDIFLLLDPQLPLQQQNSTILQLLTSLLTVYLMTAAGVRSSVIFPNSLCSLTLEGEYLARVAVMLLGTMQQSGLQPGHCFRPVVLSPSLLL